MSPLCLYVPVLKGGLITLVVVRLRKLTLWLLWWHTKRLSWGKSTRQKNDLLPFKTAFLSLQCFCTRLSLAHVRTCTYVIYVCHFVNKIMDLLRVCFWPLVFMCVCNIQLSWLNIWHIRFCMDYECV